MLEIPEALVEAGQLNDTVRGRTITRVVAAATPHKFAFFTGDPGAYHAMLAGLPIKRAAAIGGMVEMEAGSIRLVAGDGAGLRYHEAGAPRPKKHQLLMEFDDGSALSATVQMYGGLWCFVEGEFDNKYYTVAREKPSPLHDSFDGQYFSRMIGAPEVQKLSLKAFLATEQRIPGLGNGVFQDIAWQAGLHPRRKILDLPAGERELLFVTLKRLLREMTEQGGRDTEKDLFGRPGGYRTVMSKNGQGNGCPACGSAIRKEAYLGGSIYYCPECQPL